MKNPFFKLLFSSLFVSNLSIAYYAPVDYVFVPPGIDQNQDMEIYFSGYLPNPCFKAPVVKSVVENENINLFVNSERKYQENAFCADVIIPFFDHVNLGKLNPGDYNLIVNEKSSNESMIQFNIANRQIPKSVEYAKIVNVSYDVDNELVQLNGIYENDCQKIGNLKIKNNKENVYSIFPILKKIKSECNHVQEAFNYSFKLKNELPSDKVLLHVIIKDGMSVNALFNAKISDEEI